MSIDTTTMKQCTQSYKNSHWVMVTDEGVTVAVLKAKPFKTLSQRLQRSLSEHYDYGSSENAPEIKSLKEINDQLHEVVVYIPTDIEDGYNETITLTPAWEY